MAEFVTVATYTYPHEITILKHQLNLNNIDYYFENEATTSVAPFYSIALGGIRLRVHPDDEIRVKEILKRLDESSGLEIV